MRPFPSLRYTDALALQVFPEPALHAFVLARFDGTSAEWTVAVQHLVYVRRCRDKLDPILQETRLYCLEHDLHTGEVD